MKEYVNTLLDDEDLIMRVGHISERFKDKQLKMDFVKEIFDYKTIDCFLVICKYQNKYLIGKLRDGYEFCPGDWDFLTPHMKPDDDLRRVAKETPIYYAELETTRILTCYHTFMWLDLDSKVWWHFWPFLVEVKSNQFILDPNKKYSEFRWVTRDELKKYSRQQYFEDVCSKTLDVNHLYVGDYTTVYDKERGYYNFSPHRL